MTFVFVNFTIRSHYAFAANAYGDRLANFARRLHSAFVENAH